MRLSPMSQEEKDEFIAGILRDPEKRTQLSAAMSREIDTRWQALREEHYNTPMCPCCGLKDPEVGAEIGCKNCIVTVVMES